VAEIDNSRSACARGVVPGRARSAEYISSFTIAARSASDLREAPRSQIALIIAIQNLHEIAAFSTQSIFVFFLLKISFPNPRQSMILEKLLSRPTASNRRSHEPMKDETEND
jgi:hypothetical protein